MMATAGDGLADAAHAQDAQGAAMQVGAEHGGERPLPPVALAQPAVGLDDAPRRGHQ